MKIIPAVFSSHSKCRDTYYYSPQYPDETSQSLGFSKWGNRLGQRLPEGPKCPWPHSLLSHSTAEPWEGLATVCIPASRLAAGMCNACFCILYILCIITVITWGVAAWQDGLDQDRKRNCSGLHRGLRCVIFCSSSRNPVFLCPTSKEQTQHAAASLSAQQLPALREGSCCTALCWADLETNYLAFLNKDWVPWDRDLCMRVCLCVCV